MNKENSGFQTLLQADEERVRNTLRAAQSEENSREKSLRTLSDELGTLLLRHNAACVEDRMRQAAADSMTATARDCLSLLMAGRAELVKSARRTRAGAPYLLFAAAGLCAAAVFLTESRPLVGYIGMGLAVICAFLAGRLWTREGTARAETRLDPDGLWDTLRKTAETMDRKLEELTALAEEQKAKSAAAKADQPLDPKELALLTELLEALYAGSGEYALLQLKKLRPYLRDKGLELVDYSGETQELFELLPSKQGAVTLRPALMQGEKLLVIGRATQPVA